MSLSGASSARVEQVASVVQAAHLEKIAKNGRLRVVISDDGLSPEISRGDVVTVAPLKDKDIPKRNDLLFFRCRNRGFARRFERMDGTNLVLRDSVGYEDVAMPSDVLGRVVRVERDGIRVSVRGIKDDTPSRPLLARLTDWLRRAGAIQEG